MIPLEQNEKILLEARKHWFIFLLEALTSIATALFPLLGLVIFGRAVSVNLSPDSFYLITFLYLGWLVLVWIYFFLAWTDYYLDVLLVTSERIIEIEQKGIFHREVSSFYLDRVQDITIQIPGFFPTILDYGHLHIQTAGEQREFIMTNTARPEVVKSFILKQCKIDEENKNYKKRA